MAEFFDFLNAITNKKNPTIMEDDLHAEKEYEPYSINKSLMHHLDCLDAAVEMNGRPHTDKKMQFDFLINSIRKKFRKGEKWLRPEVLENIKYVKEYFNYSNDKARAALKILSDDDIMYIKYRLRKGGKRDDRNYDTS